MDINSIPESVYSAVYQNLGGDFEKDTDEVSDKITRKIEHLSVEELFNRFLIWHGIIGFTGMIISAYEGTIGRSKNERASK